MAGQFRVNQTLRAVLLAMLLLLTVLQAVNGNKGGERGRRRSKRGDDKCSSSSVAEYKLTFYGAWSEEKFPRMYPQYRPHAQWSKLVGRSHSSGYHMWREGARADPALKRFAENGDSLMFDAQPQGYNGIFDTFYCDPIKGGEGKTSTFIMADGKHSKVSFVVKIVPSPDWFVGADGLDLCRSGKWRARVRVNLRPLDAGTDRGYTFTSPRWPSDPPEAIYQITSSYPDHPASAFLYPEYKRLPRMAHVQLERVSQYTRKGGESSLKSNQGPNVVIFNDDKKTTTMVTNTLNVTQAEVKSTTAENPTFSANEMMKTSAMTFTTKSTTTTSPKPPMDQIENSSTAEALEEKDRASVLPQHQQLQEEMPAAVLPVSSAIASTSSYSNSTKSVSIPATTKLPTTSVLAVVEEDVKLQIWEKDIEAYQHDDAQFKALKADHEPDWLLMEGHSLNERSRRPVSALDNDDNDTSKEESLQSIGTTGNATRDSSDPGIGDLSQSNLSVVMASSSSSVLLTPKEPFASEMTNSRQASIVSKEGIAAQGSLPSGRTPISNNTLEAGNLPLGKTLAPHLQTTRSTSPSMIGMDVQELSSSQEESRMSLVNTTPTTSRAIFTPTVKPMDTTKVPPPSPDLPDAPDEEELVVSGRSQMKSSSSAKHRPRITSERTKPTLVMEPKHSQSEHTFDEPQFAEVAASHLFPAAKPVDCQVREWAEWSSCSKTCGFGVRNRKRGVISHSKNGGFACPVLEQETLCGSMRSCNWKHFSFLSVTQRPRSTRRRRRHHHGEHRTQEHGKRR